ncbi:MAG: AAA family ATPase [Candidatus Kerfeldbacteria bacterium]|nr:AAA family ATPase [Candidatus Kerfeldbacteria bacterium]
MYLDRLVINGFKSFAEATTFSFEHPFVAIVGPNGSGKTNVADAMRWVMGEQSLKLLRLKKPIDAIFSGSAQRARLGLAQVDLHLNNQDGRLALDYRDVIITRRLARDGESEYMINHEPVRLQDIILLLAQANFGQKSYGVIGQGMVTDILNANPPDRKLFFDEATGVREFQIKRDQSVNKLIRTEDNLVRVEDLLKEIEPRLQSLTRQIKKLAKRQDIEQQLHTVQTNYYGSLLAELKQKLHHYASKQRELIARRSVVQEELNAIEHDIDAIARQASRGELFQELQQTYQTILHQKNEVLKEQTVLHGRIEIEHQRIGAVDLAWLQRHQANIQQRLRTHRDEASVIEQSIQHQQQQLERLQLSYGQIQQELSKLELAVANQRTVLTQAAAPMALTQIKQRLTKVLQQQEQFLRDILNTTSLQQFKHVQQQAEQVTEQLARLLDELSVDQSSVLANQQRELTNLEQRCQDTAALKGKLLDDVTQAQIQLNTKQEKLRLLDDTCKELDHELTVATNDLANTSPAHTPKQTSTFEHDLATIERRLQQLDAQLAEHRQQLTEFNRTEENKQQRLLQSQTQTRQIQTELNQLTNDLQSTEIEITKLTTKQEDIEQTIAHQVTATVQTAIQNYTAIRQDHDQLLITIERLQHQLELIGGIDPETVQEHTATKERFDFLKHQAKDLRATMTSLEHVIDELDVTIKRQFDKSFKAIAKSFQKYFTVLFGGGIAKLDMITATTVPEVDQPVPTEVEPVPPEPSSLARLKKKQRIVSGIDIVAQPAGKKLQSVQALSGGEKSMTAIALICAIIDANTPPFVVLDEVEAALDESNSEKFSAIIKQLSKKTQFIIITHNRATMHQADVLYGVTMGHDSTSHILSVKLTEAEKMVDPT